jgi:hypothetical protein
MRAEGKAEKSGLGQELSQVCVMVQMGNIDQLVKLDFREMNVTVPAKKVMRSSNPSILFAVFERLNSIGFGRIGLAALGFDREEDGENRPSPGSEITFRVPPCFLNDLLSDEKAEAGAFRSLCAEKSGEYVFPDLLIHSATVVGHLKHQCSVSFQSRGHFHPVILALLFVGQTGINGIVDKVEQAAMNPFGIQQNVPQMRVKIPDNLYFVQRKHPWPCIL